MVKTSSNMQLYPSKDHLYLPLSLLKSVLNELTQNNVREPEMRPSVSNLLQHPFVTAKFSCCCSNNDDRKPPPTPPLQPLTCATPPTPSKLRIERYLEKKSMNGGLVVNSEGHLVNGEEVRVGEMMVVGGE
ncbi:unnamed protein product [Lactuca saligna]|uniref:Uncharacterized protein n=1 Tax=Lactuca saligna TaxID=75948 RepID=A0AA35VHE7_LACSI|nr:unnamed protein product [Lactuca saligna]